MTTIVLLFIALALCIFGLRYFAKLLTVNLFRLDLKYSTPPSVPGPGAAAPGRPFLRLGQDLAQRALLLTLIGTAIVTSLGWGPPFVWLLLGVLLIGGTAATGLRWLSLKRGEDAAIFVHRRLGPGAALVLRALLTAVLMGFNVLLTAILVRALTALPIGAGAFLLQLALIAVAATALARGLNPLHVAILLLVFALLAALAAPPFAIDGALGIRLGAQRLAIDPIVVWTAAAAAGWYALRGPRGERGAGLHGALAGAQVALLCALAAGALVLAHPATSVAQYVAPAGGHAFALLILALTGAAVGGAHLLGARAHDDTGVNESDLHIRGYAVTLAVGLIAVVGLLALASAGTPPAARDPVAALLALVAALVQALRPLALGDSVHGLVGGVVLTALAYEIAHGLRATQRVWNPDSARVRDALLAAGVFVGGVALANTTGLSPWLVLGAANLALGGLGLVLVGVALGEAGRPRGLVLGVGLAVVAIAIIGLALVWPTLPSLLAGIGAVLVALTAGLAGLIAYPRTAAAEVSRPD